MSDYTKTTNFTAKDSLATGDPLKLIKGSLFDTEFDALVIAVATKYDTDNLASQVQAEGLTDNTVLMTPLRVNDVLADNGGLLQDIQALADPGGDRLLGWDDSANDTILFTIAAPLQFNLTELEVAVASLTAQGTVEVADQTEVNAGSDTLRSVSPSTLAACTNLLQGTLTQRGALELATQVEVDAGSDADRAVSPATLASFAGISGGYTGAQEKTADQVTDTDIVLTDDDDLVITGVVAGTYKVELYCRFDATTTGGMGFQYRINYTGTLTRGTCSVVQVLNSVHTVVQRSINSTQAIGTIAIDAQDYVLWTGTMVVSDGGTLSLQWAQNSSNANNLTVFNGSYLTIQKIA